MFERAPRIYIRGHAVHNNVSVYIYIQIYFRIKGLSLRSPSGTYCVSSNWLWYLDWLRQVRYIYNIVFVTQDICFDSNAIIRVFMCGIRSVDNILHDNRNSQVTVFESYHRLLIIQLCHFLSHVIFPKIKSFVTRYFIWPYHHYETF